MTRSVTNREQSARSGEQGYLLLILVVIFALLLIAMAVAAPKIKSAIQRDHEYDLQHRGMEYAHAIKLYYKKTSTYPTNINQLVSTNNIRFLRKKYVDPITGNPVWRPVYFGQVGTGGNVNPNCSQSGGSFNGSSGSGSSIFGSSGSGLGSNTGSSFGSSGSSGFGSSGNSGFGASSTMGCDPNATGSTTGASTNGSMNNNGAPVDPVAAAIAGLSGTSQGADGTPAAPVYPTIGPDTKVPDPAGFLTPSDGFGSGALSNTVAGGGFGSSSPTGQAGTGGSFGTGGVGAGGQIVGVASLSHKESILTIKGKNHYNDLEFIYDPTKDFGGVAGLTGTGVGGGASTPFGNTGQQSPSGFGGTQSPGGFGGIGTTGGTGSQGGSGFGSGFGSNPGTGTDGNNGNNGGSGNNGSGGTTTNQ
jgi:type II secretory pathway pseudopilin PulG